MGKAKQVRYKFVRYGYVMHDHEYIGTCEKCGKAVVDALTTAVRWKKFCTVCGRIPREGGYGTVIKMRG